MSEPEMKRLLVWFVAQCEGDSGTGASYWEQFPEFCRAQQIARDSGEPLPLPVELTEEALPRIRALRDRIALSCAGQSVGMSLAALAFEVSVTEGSAGATFALFDEWLHYWRSRIPQAKAEATINRRLN